ncbi:MAG TPA: hypothetical protein V6C90_27165 [Coleofasciculaceae cyanobacterium]
MTQTREAIWIAVVVWGAKAGAIASSNQKAIIRFNCCGKKRKQLAFQSLWLLFWVHQA